LQSFLSADVRASLAGHDPEAELAALLPPGMSRWAGLSRDQFVEAQTLLYGYLLSSQGDRVAMANSVEGRVPFLDHRVIEFANRLPPRYKLRGLMEKAVLRKSVQDLLPPSIVNRVKQPYRAPDSQSFFQGGEGAALAAEMLSPERIRDVGYFEPEPVRRLVEKCRAGKAIGFADNMAFVGILSTMLLHDAFLRPSMQSAA
jgi:asparagine synthase (glutamine-hydrolysing)